VSELPSITALARDAGVILRPRPIGARGPILLVPARRLLALLIAATITYGLAIGTFRVQFGSGWLQPVYSAIKTPLLLIATTALCLPAFFVVNTVLGLRERFGPALRAILGGQAALAIVLASFSPLLLVFYLGQPSSPTGGTYRAAHLANIAAFLAAALVGQVVTRRGYRPLILENPRHRVTLLIWFALYAFVGIQMGWMLRPFIGHPASPVTFFRQEPFTNAYEVVLRILFG
jgi:hypothetical protein